jgi:hypothetical protein
MSSISVLQAPGPGQVTSVKTSNDSSPAPSTTTAGTAAATADSGPQYTNPRVEIDPQTQQVILEYRDVASGSPQYQTPSKAQLLLYQGTQNQATPGPVPAATGATAV